MGVRYKCNATLYSAAIVNYLDVNYLCLMYSCTQSRQFMQRQFMNSTNSEHWIGLETEVPSQQCEEFSTRQEAEPPSVFFSAQCASVWGGFRQEADPHPSIQPFPILAAAQRGNFKRHVQCEHCTSY